MGLFDRNPNEANYVGGKKHFLDVIKNSGPGEMLIWLCPEEDFNSNSVVIVSESEEALFYRDGIIQDVLGAGRHPMKTDNYPFLSRIRNALSGGISTFNCKVYFVRKAVSMEILWGTDTPIQVRDPKFNIATSLSARGGYAIQVEDSKKFLLKLVGNNVPFLSQQDLTLYFRNTFSQYVKSGLAQVIQRSGQEILGINARQTELAGMLHRELAPLFGDYGLRLVGLSIASLDIPEDDPNRQRLEDAYSKVAEVDILGDKFGKLTARDLLTDVARNPGAGGMAAGMAGVGMGVASAGIFNSMAQQIFEPMNSTAQQPQPQPAAAQGSRFVQREEDAAPAAPHAPPAADDGSPCVQCGEALPKGAKFCLSCGAQQPQNLTATCPGCGAQVPGHAKFCLECGGAMGGGNG